MKVKLLLVEVMWTEIKTNHGPVAVAVVYRQPANSTCDCEKFWENLTKFL